jgi:Na+-driven multidrug efflux pump
MAKDLLSYIRDGRPMTRQEKMHLIVQLSVPSILAQISATVMFFIDASMVGHLGARATAAIGLVESSTWLLGGLASACNMGFSVQVAHFIGAKDFEGARRVLRQSLVCALLWSVMLMVGCIAIHQQLPYWLGGSEEIARDASIYFMLIGVFGIFFQMEGLAGSMLKCSGNMKLPSALNILMCCLDVAFNYVFIYRLGMGVMGAAIGTGLAEFVTAGLMLYFLLCRSDMLRLFNKVNSEKFKVNSYGYNKVRQDSVRLHNYSLFTKNYSLKRFRPTADVVHTAFKIGAPMGLQHLLTGGAYVVGTIIVAPLGTVAIAANSLAITVESLCYMPGYGIAEAATTLVGQGIGAGQRLLTRSLAHMSVALGIACMTVMGVLMWVFAPELMMLMSPVEEVVAEGSAVLRIEAWAEPMFAASIVANGVFIGAGDTLKPAAMSLASMWGVRLTLAAWLATRYGLQGVWIAMATELTFRGIIFLVRLFMGNWNKKLERS